MEIVAMALPRRHAHALPSSFSDPSPSPSPSPLPPSSFYPRALPLAISVVLLVCLLLPLQNRIVSVETLTLERVGGKGNDPGHALKLAADNWDVYTLEEAVPAVAQNGIVIVCVVSYPYLPFLVNWLVSVGRQGRHDAVLVIAEDYKLLHHVNKHWPGHAVLLPPVLPYGAAQRFGSEGRDFSTSHLAGRNIFYAFWS